MRKSAWRASAALMCLFPVLLAASAARAQSDILTYKGADRQQRLLDGAKKEGKLTFYSAMIVNQALRPISDAFQKKYPFIKMGYWRADSEDLMAKYMAEYRSDNVVGDVLEAGDDAEKALDRARDAKERAAAAVDLAALGPAGYVTFIAGTARLQTPRCWSATLTPPPSFCARTQSGAPVSLGPCRCSCAASRHGSGSASSSVAPLGCAASAPASSSPLTATLTW